MCCKSQLSRRHTFQARKSNPGQAFLVLSGEGQAWDHGKKQCKRFLEPLKQLFLVLKQLQAAGPQQSQERHGKGYTPAKSALWGGPPTKHISDLTALGHPRCPLCLAGQGPWVAVPLK